MTKLTKRPEPDGTFTLLDAKGGEKARGLSEGDADAQIASAAGTAGPADGSAQTASSDKAGAKDGGSRTGKPRKGGKS